MPSYVGMDPPKDPAFEKTPCLACLDVFDKGWPSSAGKWTSRAGVENPWTRHLPTSFILFVSSKARLCFQLPHFPRPFILPQKIENREISLRMNICHSLLTNGRQKCNNTLAWWICSLMFFCGIYKKSLPPISFHLFMQLNVILRCFSVLW